MIDAKLRLGSFPGTADIYAANPSRLVVNISDRNRESRRIVHYPEIPKVLIDAVITVEDKRFYHHNGFDALRMVKAAYVDLKDGRKQQGASTLTMQLVRNLWLAPDKSWKRKVAEVAMAIRLEEKLSKQEILEYYCNQVYLGRRGAFSLHGFGAAASAYFNKDIRDITLPEAALLAGLIQRPSYFHPLGSLERIQERRNLVLGIMRRNGVIVSPSTGDCPAQPPMASISLRRSGLQEAQTPKPMGSAAESLRRSRLRDWSRQPRRPRRAATG